MNIAILFFGIASISNVSGAEKVFVDMANRFVKEGHIVYSIWNDEPGVVPYYSFSPKVRQVNLGLGKIKAPIKYKFIREVAKGLHLNVTNYVDRYKTEKLCQSIQEKIKISDIDVMICYEFNSIMVANKLANGKIPVVAMCHNSVDKAKKLLNTDIYYIPNVVNPIPDNAIADLSADKTIYKIIMIGRIDRYQKRSLIAIKSFLEIAAHFPNWELHFYGPITDSKYKKEIDEYIESHDLHHQVIYEGITDNSIGVLHDADIFAFPSAFEGFSLALTEANSMGVPAVGFSSAPAINELIEDNVTGFLAKDERDFTQKLSALMKDKKMRIQMGKAAHQAMNKYSPDEVWGMWLRLLNRLVAENK